ncbi:MAG: TonB-dependent receptor [Massilia sp.]|nr:TonB-dependent receptor [Massilia sp.]
MKPSMPRFKAIRLSPLLYLLYSTGVFAQHDAPPVPVPVPAPAPALAPASVEISATRDRARQQDTAAMTVIRRDELLRFGDQSVADALKRVPGITVGGVQGRGGEIRMRGLGNGYTRVLLDGQPAPSGFAIESISPDQIERVEVQRVATADSGAQAIAGTINIVLRKASAKPEREFKAALSLAHDRATAELNGQFSGQFDRVNASLGVVAVDARAAIASTDRESGFDAAGGVILDRSSRSRQDEHRPTINLTPRLVWTLPNGDTLTSQNFLRFLALDMRTRNSERTALGEPTSFPDNSAQFRAHTRTQRSDLLWLHQMEQGARLEVQLGLSRFRRRATNDFEGAAVDPSDNVSRIVDSTAKEDNWSLTGKWTIGTLAPLLGHALVAGWDAARGERTETRFELMHEVSTARLARLALYLQDDWTVTPALSLSLGARYEAFHIDSSGNVLDTVKRRLYAGGPLLQARLKTSQDGQVRLGLTRTFKLPTLARLSMRRYTVDNNNSPLTPDEQGNAALLPERAWGLDLAYEHYFSKSAMLSASVYARRIDDVTVARIEQRAASWVQTPVNAGRADTRGIELEGKSTLAGFELRANAARNWSRIDSLPSPGNRLPDQAPFSAGAGVDRRIDGWPLTLSANLTIQGGAQSRYAERILVTGATQRELNLAALWRVDARSSWRLSASNLLAQRNDSTAQFRDAAGSLRSLTATPTWTTLRLAYERKM